MTRTIQIRKKGSITIPMELRKRYRIDEGDPLTLVDLGEGFFLSPRQSVLLKLVAEIETLRQKNNITLEELIQGVAKERAKWKKFLYPMIPLKIFFDADTLIAGSASQTGASFLLLQLCEIRILRGLTCRQVVAEFRRNLIKKLPQAEPIFDEIVKRALETKKNPTLDEQKKYRQTAHPKDLPILTSAIKSRGDYLVTFNTKHYFPVRECNLAVLQPVEMLQKIRLILTHLESMNGS